MFQLLDRKGNRYMEYIRDHGQFADLPLEQVRAAFEKHYPSLMSGGTNDLAGTFEDEAAADQALEQ